MPERGTTIYMEPTNILKADAVFEGGGVKGSGLLGAVVVTERMGYTFENLAGTSAGAIIAALLAAGYSAIEAKTIIDEIDYTQLMDKKFPGTVPLVGPLLSIVFKKGMYEGDFFLNSMRELLGKKHVYTFKDLIREKYKDDLRYRYKLQVVVSDVTGGRMLILPGDIKKFDIEPDDLEVALAIRMSMSIPYFYQPVKCRTKTGDVSYLVDGGILSNFPVEIFDDQFSDEPPWPVFGYKLVDPEEGKPHAITGPLTLFSALFSTMMEAHDARYIQDADFLRTIPIKTLGIRTTDFGISREQKEALYESGVAGAEEFFKHWNFEQFKAEVKIRAAQHRHKQLWTE